MAGKKNRITTTTTTSVQDRRIGAEGGSTIVSEGGSLRNDTQITETFNLVDSDTAQASVEALSSVSRSALDAMTSTAGDALGANSETSRAAIEANTSAAMGLFDRASDVFSEASGLVGRAFDLSEAAGLAQQQTASEALAKTASEGNQALETITRGAMAIAAAFFLSRIFRG